jgi:hypothetical protein
MLVPALPAWAHPCLRVVVRAFKRVRGQQDRVAARRRGRDALGRRAGLIVSGSIPLFGQQMREHAGHSPTEENLRARPPQAAVLVLLFWRRPQRGVVGQPFGVAAVRDRQRTLGPAPALGRVAVGCLVATRPQVRVVHMPAAVGALCQPNATNPAAAKSVSTAGSRIAARALMLARAPATSLPYLAIHWDSEIG